jgi:hypothetical protein
MAQILDFNTPSVNPSGAPPNDYLRIQANPNMFGAQTGQALEKLGGAFEKASNAATEVVQFQQRIDVDDQTNKFLDARNKLLYGDPSKQLIGPDGKPTIDRGFMGLEGRAASDARDGMLKSLEEVRQAGKNNLQNPMAQLAYDQQTRRIYNEAETHVGSHTDQQWKIWAGGVNAAGAAHELNDFVNAIGDPAKMEGYAHNYISFKVQQAQLKFGDDAGIKSQAEAQAKVELLEAHVNAVAVRDPDRALQILESNKNTAGVKYDDMYNRLRDRADAQVGAKVGENVWNRTGGKFSAPVNDAITGAAQRYGIDPNTLRRAAQIESSGNPNAVTGSYKGLFQLSQAEFQKYAPAGGDIYNPADNALAAAAKMKAEGAAFASQFGRQPSGFDSYMIHQQGLGGYSAHLANPASPAWQNMAATGEGRQKGENWAKQAIWGNIPDQYKAMFGSVDNVTSRDFIAMWAVKFGAQPPPSASAGAVASGQPTWEEKKVSALRDLIDDPDLRDRPRAFATAWAEVEKRAQIEHATAIDTDRAEKLAEKARKQQSLAVEDEYLKDAYDANPQKTAVDVVNDPRLVNDPETRKKIIAFQERANKPDPIAPISQKMTRQLFDRMRLPDGDPNKIKDLGPINTAMSEGKLTRADYDWVTNQFKNSETPDGEKLVKRKTEFLKGVAPQIDQTDMNLGIKDLGGQERFYRFEWDLDHLMEEDRKAGKNPWNRLDPTKPEYMGRPEALAPYRKTTEQIMAEWGTNHPAPAASPEQPGFFSRLFSSAPAPASAGAPATAAPTPAAPQFNPASVKNLAELQAAFGSGRLSREQAMQLAVERGWAVRKPAAPPAAGPPAMHVPLSQ